MGKTYKQFSLEERCTIASLQKEGKSIRQIATSLDRAPSSISREIKRNTGTGIKANYSPAYADEMAWSRRWSGSRMERQPDLRFLLSHAGWRLNKANQLSHMSLYIVLYMRK